MKKENGFFLFCLLLFVFSIKTAYAFEQFLDQSIFIKGLSSTVAPESSGSCKEDVTPIMLDGLIEQSRRIQKNKGKYDTLSFLLNAEGSNLSSLIL